MKYPAFPARYRLLNRLGDLLRVSQLPSFQFCEDTLCHAARKKCQLSDFGDPWFREGLQHLLQSLKEVELTPIGCLGIHGMLVTQLANRLHFVHNRKRRPEDYETSLRPPLVICGLPRSGTTLLHRMLCSDPINRAIPFWEMMRPTPSVSAAERLRLADKSLKQRRALTPEVDRIHYVRAHTPEECMWMLSMTFCSHAYWVSAPVYSYLTWLKVEDRIRAYQEFRALLSPIQKQDEQRRLLLKAPSHSGSLAALRAAIPGAMIIQVIRDPVEVFASFCSLIATTHRAVVEHLDINRLARANLELLSTETERNLAYREHSPGRVCDVRYQQLVDYPVETARRIYRSFGLHWTKTAESGLHRFLRENPKNRFGRHHYSLSEWGISERELRKIFGRLCERYGSLSG